MKFKTTNKAIKDNYFKIARVGYCDLQTLLRYKEPFAYTCGSYGWNANFYDLNGVCICTGYRSLIGESIPHEIIKKYEQKARAIMEKYVFDYKKASKSLDKLIEKFLIEIDGIF